MKKITSISLTAMLLAGIASTGFSQMLPPPTASEPDPTPIPPPPDLSDLPSEDIGFTWGNDIPEMIKRGNDTYSKANEEEKPDNYKTEALKRAEEFYRNARLRDPEQAVAPFNLGLIQSAQKDEQSAINSFQEALNLAGENAQLREKALYNLGVSHLNAARNFETDKKRGEAIEQAIRSLDASDAALKINPDNAQAAENRRLAQHLLQYFATPPQESPESKEGDQGEQGDQGQNQNQQQQPQQGDQPQDQPQNQDQQNQNQQQPNQSQSEGSEGQQQQQQAQGQPENMTPDEAKRLLNLLGESDSIVFQQRQNSQNQPKDKDW